MLIFINLNMHYIKLEKVYSKFVLNRLSLILLITIV